MKNTIYENLEDCGKSRTIYKKKTFSGIYSKATEYKVDTQTSVAFLYASSKN